MATEFVRASGSRIDFNSAPNILAKAGSYSFWLYPDDVTNNQYFFIAHTSSDTSTRLICWHDGSGRIRFQHTGSTALTVRSSNSAISTGSWQHVLITWDGSVTAANVHIYVDGVETGYIQQTNGVALSTSQGSFSLGGRIYDDTRNFDGKMDCFCGWSVVLGSDEIAALAGKEHPQNVRPDSHLMRIDLEGWQTAAPDYAQQTSADVMDTLTRFHPSAPVNFVLPFGGSTFLDPSETIITGSGTPQAQAAQVSGSGERGSTGSDAPQAQASQVSGAGVKIITGSGTPQAQSAQVSADATGPLKIGDGAAQAQASQVSGSGQRSATGAGTSQAQASIVDGTGQRGATGSDAAQAQSAQISGDGVQIKTGAGTPQAQPATVDGAGQRGSTGSGAPQAQAAQATGTGSNLGQAAGITGSGTAQAQNATVDGTGQRGTTGSGTPQAQVAQVSGTGVKIITASGQAAAQNSQLNGAGNLLRDGEIIYPDVGGGTSSKWKLGDRKPSLKPRPKPEARAPHARDIFREQMEALQQPAEEPEEITEGIPLDIPRAPSLVDEARALEEELAAFEREQELIRLLRLAEEKRQAKQRALEALAEEEAANDELAAQEILLLYLSQL